MSARWRPSWRWGVGAVVVLGVLHLLGARLLLSLGWAEQLLSPGGDTSVGLLAGLAFVLLRLVALFVLPGLSVVLLGRAWTANRAAHRPAQRPTTEATDHAALKSAPGAQDDIAEPPPRA